MFDTFHYFVHIILYFCQFIFLFFLAAFTLKMLLSSCVLVFMLLESCIVASCTRILQYRQVTAGTLCAKVHDEACVSAAICNHACEFCKIFMLFNSLCFPTCLCLMMQLGPYNFFWIITLISGPF